MNLIGIIRFFRGYLLFEIYGGFTERFINLCAAHRVNIWNANLKKDSMTACVLTKNFRKLRPIAKKAGCRLKIVKKVGIPFFMNKSKDRIGLLISVCFFAVFFIVMNQFVWTIEVTGSETVSSEEIQNITEKLGLCIGKPVSQLDVTHISRQAVNHFSGRLQWMSINIKGSKAVIEVRDYTDIHEDSDYGDPCNIVADFDGVLLSVEVLNGDKIVDEGNAVKEGDLLISGIIENEDLSCIYTEARGKITALHHTEYSKQYSKNYNEYTGIITQKEIYTIDILGLKIPLGFVDKNQYDSCFEYKTYISYNGTTLPFGIIKTSYIHFEEKKEKTNAELLLSLDDFTRENYSNLKNTYILSTANEVEIINNEILLKNNIECIDFIGVQSPIVREFYEN